MADESVDVVVVGTGAAACSGALGALLHLPSDAKVLVLEKSAKLKGGTTNLAGGAWGWFPRNHFLKSIGVDDPEDSVVTLLEHLATVGSRGGASPPSQHEKLLMRAFARESPHVLEALHSRGLLPVAPPPLSASKSKVGQAEELSKMRDLILKRIESNAARGVHTGLSADNEEQVMALAGCLPDYSGDDPLSAVPGGRTLQPHGGTTSSLLLKSVGSFANSEIRMGHEVVGLLRDGGRVAGVEVKTKDGTKKISSRYGVIFGSGGYAHNSEMIESQHGRGVVSGSCSARTNKGDLVRICQSEGIPVTHLDLAWWKQVVLPFDAKRIVSGGAFFLNADSFMVVDTTGKRYSDEKNFYQQRGLEMLDSVGKDVDRRYVFFIMDERSLHRFAGPLKGLGGPIPFDDSDPGLMAASDEGELAGKLQDMLDKITGVAESFKLAPNFATSLKDQINRFNKEAVTGVDSEFARGSRANTYAWHVGRQQDNTFPNKTMFPLDYSGDKKLYALVLGISTLDTKGGPVVDATSRILANGQPIPGLYGAGNCVSGYSGRAYPAAGATISNGITFGFIAGRHAVTGVGHGPVAASKL